MAEVTSHPPGAFCWIDLAAKDPEGAKRFYCGLFGWEAKDISIGPDAVYTMLMLRMRSADVAGIYHLTKEDLDRGGHPQWLSYVSVPNAGDTANRARSLGAAIVKGPLDVLDRGRLAVIQDLEGAPLGLWQPHRETGAMVVNEPGALCWNELATRDPAKSTSFYTRLFGWSPKISGPGYTELLNGIVPIGAIFEIPKEWGDVQAHWLSIFCVEDCDGTARKSQALRGRVKHGPADLPNGGRCAIIADPEGAIFAIFERAQQVKEHTC